ncbi:MULTISPECIES: trypsin-like peptidase domain-containing protein [Streptomyces]|uniref:Serine protease n=1 Tax=Streptomyces parvus TaxID=66428 RepID=A0A5D4IRT1_9ACTN|nr:MULTISPECIES: trypsin-like peptidase domain-containing protein [Streptomyces]TYR55878.1 serine protease [Streptomyces parvus]
MNVNTPGRQLLFSTVRLDNVTASGAVSTGTGFILLADLENGRMCPLLVTNKHVVAHAARLSAHFIVRKPDIDEPNLGQGAEVALPPNGYFGHPNPRVDIAVVPLASVLQQFGAQLFMRALPLSLLATEVANLYVDAIEEITFIGYPNGHRDPKHLTPIIRRGITATPLDLDMGGDPAFLVDGSVFGGSSGSPVFLFNEGSYRASDNGLTIGTRIVLIGIVSATMVRHAQLPIEAANAEHVKIAQELNLGVVFNARAIKETIEAFVTSAGEKLRTLDGGPLVSVDPVTETSTPLT